MMNMYSYNIWKKVIAIGVVCLFLINNSMQGISYADNRSSLSSALNVGTVGDSDVSGADYESLRELVAIQVMEVCTDPKHADDLVGELRRRFQGTDVARVELAGDGTGDFILTLSEKFGGRRLRAQRPALYMSEEKQPGDTKGPQTPKESQPTASSTEKKARRTTRRKFLAVVGGAAIAAGAVTVAWLAPSPFEQELARIEQLTHINGVPIKEIESRARPEAHAATGFLGHSESLKEVMKEDAIAMHQVGRTKEEFAEHLRRIIKLTRIRQDLLHALGDPFPFTVEIQYHGQPLRIFYAHAGSQDSILKNEQVPDENNPDNRSWGAQMEITNLNNGLRVRVGGDIVKEGTDEEDVAYGIIGYIERHGIFEGGGRMNPYRVDPLVLDAILAGKTATEELRQRESITYEEFAAERAKKRIERKIKEAIKRDKEAPRYPEEEESFRAFLRKLPNDEVHELLALARRRHIDYIEKLYYQLPRRYGIFVSDYMSSPDNDTIIMLDITSKQVSLGTLFSHPEAPRINFSQQVEILEKYVEEMQQEKRPDGASLQRKASHVTEGASATVLVATLEQERAMSQMGLAECKDTYIPNVLRTARALFEGRMHDEPVSTEEINRFVIMTRTAIPQTQRGAEREAALQNFYRQRRATELVFVDDLDAMNATLQEGQYRPETTALVMTTDELDEAEKRGIKGFRTLPVSSDRQSPVPLVGITACADALLDIVDEKTARELVPRLKNQFIAIAGGSDRINMAVFDDPLRFLKDLTENPIEFARRLCLLVPPAEPETVSEFIGQEAEFLKKFS